MSSRGCTALSPGSGGPASIRTTRMGSSSVLPGFAWVGTTMTTDSTPRGDGRHARHGALSAAAGPRVTVDGDAGGVERQDAAGGRLGGPRRGRALALSGV